MQYFLPNNPNSSGIYRIRNLLNNRIYVGSCASFKLRWTQHDKTLQDNAHPNKFLQNDYNKCGTSMFVFEVLEDLTGLLLEQRLAREQFFIDQFYDSQKQCYNIKKFSCSREGHCSSNPELTAKRIGEASKKSWMNPVSRAKRIEAAKKHWNTPEGKTEALSRITNLWKSEEHRDAMSALMVLRNQEPEFKAKVQANLDKGRSKERYDKSKESYRVELTESRLVVETKDYQGPKRNRVKLYENACLLSPEGVLFRNIYNLSQFAADHGITDSWKLQEVIEGKRVSYKDWIRKPT